MLATLEKRIHDMARKVFGVKSVDEYEVTPVRIVVDSQNFRMQLYEDVYLLVSNILDLPVYARMVIQSDENLFSTTVLEFNAMQESKRVMFRYSLFIQVQNADFKPFTLEFLRISEIKELPNPPDTDDKQL